MKKPINEISPTKLGRLLIKCGKLPFISVMGSLFIVPFLFVFFLIFDTVLRFVIPQYANPFFATNLGLSYLCLIAAISGYGAGASIWLVFNKDAKLNRFDDFILSLPRRKWTIGIVGFFGFIIFNIR